MAIVMNVVGILAMKCLQSSKEAHLKTFDLCYSTEIFKQLSDGRAMTLQESEVIQSAQ